MFFLRRIIERFPAGVRGSQRLVGARNERFIADPNSFACDRLLRIIKIFAVAGIADAKPNCLIGRPIGPLKLLWLRIPGIVHIQHVPMIGAPVPMPAHKNQVSIFGLMFCPDHPASLTPRDHQRNGPLVLDLAGGNA